MKTKMSSPLQLVHSAPKKQPYYIFDLYVVGTSPNSMHTIECAKRLCEERLAGRCHSNIIDLYQFPALAKRENVIAIPTLVRKSPLPVKRMIEDMSDARCLLQEDNKTETG
jgi:circadian clock protein KaiB